MQRIGDELALAIGPHVPGEDGAAAQDHDLVDQPLHDDILKAKRRRHRVAVAAIADQRCRRAFAQDDAAPARKQWREVADQARLRVPKLTALMDDAEADVLAYMGFPARRPIRSEEHT